MASDCFTFSFFHVSVYDHHRRTPFRTLIETPQPNLPPFSASVGFVQTYVTAKKNVFSLIYERKEKKVNK